METIEKFRQSATAPNKAIVLQNLSDLGSVTVDSILSLAGVPIPFCTLLTSVIKTGLNFREQRFIKKAAYFLFHAHAVPDGDLNKFLQELEHSQDKKQKGAEVILDIIDRIDTNSKIEILVNLYSGYVRQQIDIEGFLRLCNALEKVTYNDLKTLNNHHKSSYELYSTDMLASAGLVQMAIYGSSPTLYTLNDNGILMLTVGLQEEFDEKEWKSDKFLE